MFHTLNGDGSVACPLICFTSAEVIAVTDQMHLWPTAEGPANFMNDFAVLSWYHSRWRCIKVLPATAAAAAKPAPDEISKRHSAL
jgi:hypothetical protein